jgi:hypothetical protein
MHQLARAARAKTTGVSSQEVARQCPGAALTRLCLQLVTAAFQRTHLRLALRQERAHLLHLRIALRAL